MFPLSLEALRDEVRRGQSFTFRPFFGHTPRGDGQLSDACFSQWWRCRFEVQGVAYSTAEQFMMAGKARLFGDAEVLARILAEADPAKVKKLGRLVRGFDEARWAQHRTDLVAFGSHAKFSQDAALRSHLLATGEAILVEASPTDRVWGIGLKRENSLVSQPLEWRGQNLLGFALVRARGVLRGELEPIATGAWL